ncbi:hypothetical protein Tco_0019423 [Tanacetum coccineum]
MSEKACHLPFRRRSLELEILEEIYVTWAQFWKKPYKIANWHNEGLKNCSHKVETASGFLMTPSGLASDGVRTLLDPRQHLALSKELEVSVTAKLRNDNLMFQQHQDESLYDAWNCFKDLLQRVPHHGLDLWLQVQIFYDHVDYATQMAIDYATGRRLRKLRAEVAWETIANLAQYEGEGWNDLIFPNKGSPDYIDANLEQELESMECRVESLMRNEVLLYYDGGFTFPKRTY